ncbi:MAG: beta strand repeat-containing protein, partial [Micrococcales bacterium]
LISISYGSATQLALTTQAAGFVNAVNFTTQPVIEVRDSAGNKVANSTLAVAVAIDSGALTGTTTVNAVAGVATFSGVGKTGLIGSKTLTFSSSGLTSATQSFTLTHGAATQVAVSAPSSSVNDVVLTTQPVVTIKDVSGNTVTTGAAATQTVTLTSTDATIAGTTSMAAVAGVADFAGLGVKLTGLVGARNLTATISSPSTITGTASVTLTYGAATKLALTTQAAGFVNRTDFTTQPVVTIQDVSGNTVANSTAAVDVSISSGTLTGTTTVNAVAGVATFAGLGKTGVIGSKTLTFASSGLTSATQTFTLTHGAASQLAIAGSTTAQSAIALTTQPTVTIQDADGNTVTSGTQSTQTVTLTSPDATIGGTTSMAAVAGVANFSCKGISLTSAVGTKTITATITSPSSYTASMFVTLQAGSATKLVLTTQAAGFVNRTDFTTQPVVEVRDAQDNVVTTSTAAVTVTISSGSLTGTATVNAVNGVATFSGLGKTGLVGSKTLTFASTGLTSATQSFTLTHGVTTQIGITNAIAPNGAPSYYPAGPQTSVTEATITAGGWTQCWSGTYGSTASLASIWAACNGSYLMLAGGPTSTTTFDVVAAAPAADVKFDTGNSNTPHNANGTGWYYSDSYSMGFALQGDALSRNSCDTGNTNPTLRLCWHTSGGSITGGYRSGATTGLNGSTTYRRVIYMASSATVTNGVAFANQPVLALKDADGNICTTDNQSVTASMTSGLTGTTAVNAVNGVVTFADLKYTGL